MAGQLNQSPVIDLTWEDSSERCPDSYCVSGIVNGCDDVTPSHAGPDVTTYPR